MENLIFAKVKINVLPNDRPLQLFRIANFQNHLLSQNAHYHQNQFFLEMRKYLILSGLGFFIWMCGSTDASSGKIAEKAPVDGGKIFKIYCVTCHGAYGDMQANGAKDLRLSALTLEERIQVITKGRNIMTPFENLLNEEKIRAVAEYTLSLKQ